MKIFVKAKPNAKQNKIEQIAENHFVIHVTAAPDKGKANTAVIKQLAEHFSVPKQQIVIKSGHASRIKLIKIY
ncbi:MAG: DUF167 domain-containing protein [Patescibacteria group bacterium]|jgi:hypothetical protein